MKITFIGLGKMGSAMVERLLHAGHTVTIYNRTAAKMEPLVAMGAIPANSVANAVKQTTVVMTSLLDDKAVLEVTGQLVQLMQPDSIHIGLSTILPDTAITLAAMHHAQQNTYISATVLGVPSVARAGELTTFCAGPEDKLQIAIPLLQAFTSNIVPLGSKINAPNVLKICMNYSLITTIELISELYTFTEKSGIDTEIVRKALHLIYAHPAYKRYIDKIHDRTFSEVNFDMKGGNKDVGIFQEAFARVGVAPEIANVVKSRFISALAHGMQDQDWSGIYEIIRSDAGLKK